MALPPGAQGQPMPAAAPKQGGKMGAQELLVMAHKIFTALAQAMGNSSDVSDEDKSLVAEIGQKIEMLGDSLSGGSGESHMEGQPAPMEAGAAKVKPVM